MSKSVNSFSGIKVMKATKAFLSAKENSLADLNFDTTIPVNGKSIGFPLGEHLHHIFTFESTSLANKDQQARLISGLRNLGITYDVLLENTLRSRNDPANPHRFKQTETVGTAIPQTADTEIPEAVGTEVPETAGTEVPETKQKGGRKKGRLPSQVRARQIGPPSVSNAREYILQVLPRGAGSDSIKFLVQEIGTRIKSNGGKVPDSIHIGPICVEPRKFGQACQTLQNFGDLDGTVPKNELLRCIDERRTYFNAVSRNSQRR